MDRSDFSIQKDQATAETILDVCREHGVCVIDSFFSEKEVTLIRGGIDRMFNNVGETSGVKTHTKEDYQHALMIQYEDLDLDSHPEINELVSRPEFEKTVREYYEENDVQYPSNLFIARSYGTENSPEGVISDGPPYALHYDKTNKFKFFFYLTDVTLDHGPTHFAPGLHNEVKEQRLRELDEGRDKSNLSNTLEKNHEMIPVTADAGSLLIFDTDVPHKAGGLTEGCEREVLRIDSLSPSHSGRGTGLTDRLKRQINGFLG